MNGRTFGIGKAHLPTKLLWLESHPIFDRWDTSPFMVGIFKPVMLVKSQVGTLYFVPIFWTTRPVRNRQVDLTDRVKEVVEANGGPRWWAWERFTKSKTRSSLFWSKDLRMKLLIWFWLDFNYQVHPPPQIWTGIFKSKSCIIFFHWLLQLIGSTFGAAKLQDEASALGGGPPVFRLGGFVVEMEEVEIMRISDRKSVV